MKLEDFFKIDKPEDYKVHIATGDNGYTMDALHSFYDGTFEKYQAEQKALNFGKRFIMSFAYYGNAERGRGLWLFVGIFEVLGNKPDDAPEHPTHKYRYNTKLTDKYESLIGRLIMSFKRDRVAYPHLSSCFERFELDSILAQRSDFEFMGYENCIIDFHSLQTIIRTENSSYKTALEHRKGVYIITDIKTGKVYIGSGYGKKALWNRWAEYVATGHGNNKKLVELIEKEGAKYAQKNFQFSIMETFKMSTDKTEIIRRESFYKKMLDSCKNGYNEN